MLTAIVWVAVVTAGRAAAPPNRQAEKAAAKRHLTPERHAYPSVCDSPANGRRAGGLRDGRSAGPRDYGTDLGHVR